MVIESTASGWERVAMAIERIQDRLRRATLALGNSEIEYAVIGGNAVAEWVGRVDSGAVRFTKDVDILLRRCDLPEAIRAMESSGFVYNETMSVHMFLDGPDASPRDAVHVVFAGEKVREEYVAAAPAVSDVDQVGDFRVLALESLIRMKLTSFRLKDQVHLQDMLSVGLIDSTWPARFPDVLGQRLTSLIENPE
jgi:hypothetical protein